MSMSESIHIFKRKFWGFLVIHSKYGEFNHLVFDRYLYWYYYGKSIH